MERDLLEHWLGQGMSLPEIGALTDRDPFDGRLLGEEVRPDGERPG
jgi:hypothetical protein